MHNQHPMNAIHTPDVVHRVDQISETQVKCEGDDDGYPVSPIEPKPPKYELNDEEDRVQRMHGDVRPSCGKESVSTLCWDCREKCIDIQLKTVENVELSARTAQ
jgi:hypothetical protein